MADNLPPSRGAGWTACQTRCLFRGPQLHFQMGTGRRGSSHSPFYKNMALRTLCGDCLAWWSGGKRTSRDGRGPRQEGVVKVGGRQPSRGSSAQKDGRRRWGARRGEQGYVGGACFGSSAELALPWVSRAARITWRGWGWGWGGEVWTNWHIHDRCLLGKNTVKSSCKENRGLLAHTPGLSACLLFSGWWV